MIGRLLAHRRFPLVVVTGALALALPALSAGWQLDDLHHRVVLLGKGDPSQAMKPTLGGLFTFADGNPAVIARARNDGAVPWWTAPELHLAFFRPLTVLTHRLDYAAWPASAPLMHAHSLAWFAAVLAAALLFFRRFLGAGAGAGLALLMFALDDAHGLPIGWLAQRNGLVAGLFALLSVVAHDRWRRDGWRPGALLGPAAFALGLLGGEAGVGAAGYLVAHALVLESGPALARFRSLVPYAALLAIWRVGTRAAGYGAAHSDFYIDPGTEPLRFLGAAARRLPVLLVGQWSPIPSDVAQLGGPEVAGTIALVGVALMALLALALAPLLRQDPLARFFALGSVLALVPVTATFPHDRNLLLGGLGAFALTAQLMMRVLRRRAGGPWPVRAAGWTMTILLGLAHLVLGPLRLPEAVKVAEPLESQVTPRLPDHAPELVRQSVVIVNGPIPFLASHLGIGRMVRGQALPAAVRTLAPSFTAVELYRPDARTLRLRPDDAWGPAPFDGLFRSVNDRFQPGDRIPLPEVTIEVTEVDAAGRATAIACVFAAPLEAASLRWLAWRDGAYAPWVPPPIGGKVRLPRPVLALPPLL